MTLLLVAVTAVELCYVIAMEFDGVTETSPKVVHYATPAIKIVTFVSVLVRFTSKTVDTVLAVRAALCLLTKLLH